MLVVLKKLRDAIDQQFDCVFEGLERLNGQWAWLTRLN
jgi:hypothetical protein